MIHYNNLANNVLKDKSLLYDFRRKIVEEYIKTPSFRIVAKKFGINVKTVIKWVKRYKESGLTGLHDKKRTPKKIYNKISSDLENIIINLRKATNFGPLRLKQVFNIKCSCKTIYRVLKKNNLIKGKKKKYKKKIELRELKKKLKPFELMQMDIKYLDDIPNFFKYLIKYNLPKYIFILMKSL